MRIFRTGIAASALIAGSIGLAPAADASTLPVGVNGCHALTPGGSYVPGFCTAVALPGYYYLSVTSSGAAYAEVNCVPLGGSGRVQNNGGGSNYEFYYLGGGDCSVVVYGEVNAFADLTAA